jgi:hypothetical protein
MVKDALNLFSFYSEWNVGIFGTEHEGSVRSTARRVVHLQFDISANALEKRAVQSLNYII